MDDRRETNQLSFESLASRNTQQTERILLNPSAPVEIRPRLKHQAKVILSALKQGPIWTNYLSSIAKQYNARIKELRDYLQPQGKTIDMTLKGKDGNNRYELRPFAGSRYEAELMKKQKRSDPSDRSDQSD